MEHFEQLALESAPLQPRLWKRYVDDTCCIVESGAVDDLLHHLNSVRPSIQFTVEVEQEGTLPFLDTCIHRMENGGLDITVYRKPTHTDRYLHFSSHHPRHVKRGLVKCLYDRAERVITDSGNLGKERKHLRTVLNINRYTRRFISSATAPPMRRRQNQGQ